MRHRRLPHWLFTVVGSTAIIMGSSATAATLNHLDDFEDGTVRGWSGSRDDPPMNVDTGGPAGAGDSFLWLTSTAGGGSGSRMAAFNTSDDWIGDFSVVGATSVEVDMMNPVDSVELQMRLVLFGPASTGNRWTSTVAEVVPNDGVWRHYSFPISPDDITRVQGQAAFDDMMSDVVRVMLRHDSGTPSRVGTPIRANLGLDNIMLSGPSAMRGDFNDDGAVDLADVNLLLTEVKAGTNQVDFDLDSDGQVNTADITEMLTSDDILNSFIGDANLDGEFGSTDLVTVFQAGEYEDGLAMNSTWEEGDWNGDAEFGSGDLVFAFQDGGYETGPRVNAVPEPTSVTVFLMWTSIALGMLRGRR